jgi:hypothetical protein
MKDIFADNKETERAMAAQDGWGSYPPFDRRHLRAIELALRAAWDRLHRDPVKSRLLSSENEVNISHLLREELDELRHLERGGVPGYFHQYFETPRLGAEIKTQGGKIRKPDIVFGLCGAKRPGVSKTTRDGIFVECKILERRGSRTLTEYCNDGLQRFVDGDYAAWMREGMMLAYVRSSDVLPNNLAPRLSSTAALACTGPLVKCTLTRVAPRVYISVHKRGWTYSEGNDRDGAGKKSPGPIEVRHLWLHV